MVFIVMIIGSLEFPYKFCGLLATEYYAFGRHSVVVIYCCWH